MGKYSDIIERLEKADGPDRNLDAAIAVSVKLELLNAMNQCPTFFKVLEKDEHCAPGTFWLYQFSGASMRTAPLYTASLDAAIALVERMLPGWDRKHKFINREHQAELTSDPDEDWEYTSYGPNDAMALLISMFRALQAQEDAYNAS
jgi:hypothetical protein